MSLIQNSGKFINPNKEISESSYISTFEEYQSLYTKSIEDPEQFWRDISKEFYWRGCATTVLDGNFDIRKGPIFVKFMSGALTNACYNVLDRHIENGLAHNIAYYWEGNDGKSKRRITYTELRREVCKFANGLKALGIKKGDHIAIYMSVSIECVVAMLACARIGAVHSVIFAGFSGESLADRIIDAKCVLLISSDGCYRGNKLIPLKNMADCALDICRKRGYQKISNVVHKHLNTSNETTDGTNAYTYSWNDQVDIWWNDLIKNVPDYCDPVWVDTEHPLFIMYTSGSTGRPKGILHVTGGYLLHNYMVVKYVYDIQKGDVFFSTADLGWMGGHYLNVYGGLANGVSNVLLEGTPTYPTPDRLWEVIDRLKVKTFFTSPTVIRMSMKLGDHYVKAHNRNSLKVLGTAGETINPEAWLWYWKVVGDGRCSIVDPYGQTENGIPMISSLPGCTPMKAGSATLPLFGVVPAVLDDLGNEILGPGKGHLVYKKLWPGIARTIVGNHDLYESTYFQKFPGYFWTGDGVRRDEDGYYWLTGRIDDTFNVSGHLLSSIEIEMAVIEHRAVAEAATVSALDSLKGEVPIVFVVLHNHFVMSSNLELDIKNRVRERIGAHSEPDTILAVNGLPKTRSGKIMRRILHKMIRNECNYGDITTMADHSVIDDIKAVLSSAQIRKTFN